MENSKTNDGFKLIGIVPLKDCAKKFRKNLIIGSPYLFYNNYEINLKDNFSAINSVKKHLSKVPTILYNLDNGIKVNVSAIVGENGSGKSAVVELFYYLVYAVSSQKKYTEIGLTRYSKIIQNDLEQLKDDIRCCKKEHESVLRFSINLQKKYNLQFDSKYTGIVYLRKLKKELREKIFFSNKLNASTNVLSKNLTQFEKDILSLDEKQDFIYRFCIGLQKKYDFQVELKDENKDYLQTVEKELEEKKNSLIKVQQESENIDKLIDKQLNVALIYEIAGVIYILEYSKSKLVVKNIEGKKIADQYLFNNFFYTISLNYSHHSLNSKVLGGWLDSLFHKNDGYRTPVVINPMRTDGIYDINHELNLSKERLMFNLAYYLVQNQQTEEEYKLLDKYKIETVNLSIKPHSYSFPMRFDKDGLKQLSSYFLLKSFINEYNSSKIIHLDICISYLEKKLEKLEKNYYAIIYKDFDPNLDKREIYFKNFVLTDNSHITKKIKQVVNYLRYAVEETQIKGAFSSIFKLKVLETISFTSEEFVSYIQENKNLDLKQIDNSLNVLNLMNYLPPAIFNIDFTLSFDNNDNILLSQLSSGEQQMIFNINTILYHLYNLQSSFSSHNNRQVYKNVSIIMDEIELYYHPDMQRKILREILDSLELIKEREAKGIESINLCFLTHSPFILSDIPSQNVLKLRKKDAKVENETNSFAANIYDLLNDDFFLEEGAIGAFASTKIKEILEKENLEAEDMKIINLIGDSFLKGVLKKKIEGKLSNSLIRTEIDRLNRILNERDKN